MSINITELMNDPSTSYWLKDSIKSALTRDIVDALTDAEMLVSILQQKCQEILEDNGL